MRIPDKGGLPLLYVFAVTFQATKSVKRAHRICALHD